VRRGSLIKEQRGEVRVLQETFTGSWSAKQQAEGENPELSNLRNTGYRG